MRYLAVLGLGVALIASTAHADMKTVTVQMTEAQEVPPHDGKGNGTAVFTVDSAAKTVAWKVTWEGLSSDAVAAHIHGPAAAGANAGVVINLAPNGMKMPLEGSASMTDAQLADLMAGKDYINVHTTVNKGGEIRGQLTPGM
jgi:CHRD domain